VNKKIISLSISAVITVVILIILFNNISLAKVVEALKQTPFKFAAAGFFFHLAAYFWRTAILYLFLKERNLSFLYLLNVHFIQNFYVHIVPAGLGEFSFPILLRKKLKTDRSFSVLLITKLAMMGLLIVLFFISFIVLFGFSAILKSRFRTSHVLAAAAVILTIILLLRRPVRSRLKENKFIKRIIDRATGFYETIKEEISRLKQFRFLSKVIGLSLLSIASLALYYYIILKGRAIDFGIFEVIFVSSIGMAVLVLPIKSIGGFGTTEGSWAVGMMLLGYHKDISIKAGFVVHIYALLNVTILFVIGLIFKFFIERKYNEARR
jgi:uncharacterized membrane protein YbhN (UPF0104 family)